ncbi:tumor necrosis factor receptor superfamily member 14-like [Esox lucius]|uniref:tumor necrosis factor receptor superfamily member 14-like n=1 Tax=Esox lucius TaxID=8010 RepID=UPI001477513F|nr:tumor necrosis factor receptor superfamily member 14-like [Esox lucius]
MNEANNQTKCFPCRLCDPEQGLFTRTECTTTENTICDVLDGFFCQSYSSNSECNFAAKHRRCFPGQRTKAPGTKSADMVCEECPLGFYSQHGVNCTAWTDCAAAGQVKTEDGTSTQDVTCEVPARSHMVLIPPFVLTTLATLFCLTWQELNVRKNCQRNLGM